ncbi:HAD family phosphatase [Nocardia sp. NPDC005998]|uniref:HAD family hydrolase n=1 Tax=Nocardia sp. NPDC005998 TaxID=3156894 RepID=UPI0033B889BA
MSGRTAVLFDFGGVLTTAVLTAFAEFGAELGDSRLPLRLLTRDPESSALLVDHEEGRIGQHAFEEGFARRLRAHGADIEAVGLVDRIQSRLHPDPAMIRLVADVRAAGYRVGLLSNSLGDDCYAGFDLPTMFDAVTISAEIGVRKPSRRAYLIGCERLGAAPEQTIMVDDLEQNITAAELLGLGGIVHRDAESTAARLWPALGPRGQNLN